MPYAGAHRWILALFPFIVFAFRPRYFGALGAASPAMHAHGLTASAWLMLLAAQSATSGRRDRAIHRTLGLATFLVVPAFAAGAAMGIGEVARRGIERGDPFHAEWGIPLSLDDIIALAGFLALVAIAVAARRRVWTHGAAMLSTALLVLPPVMGRVVQRLPGYDAMVAALDWSPFGVAAHSTMLASAIAALMLAARFPRGAAPFRLTAALLAGQSATLFVVTHGISWRSAALMLAAIPQPALAGSGAALGFAVMLAAWRAGSRRRPPSRAGRESSPAIA